MAAEPVLLLVEDDAADAHLIKRALKKVEMPARVVHVRNGDEAVAYMAGEEMYGDRLKHPLPKLVLLDVKLPRRSGLEVLRWVRQQNGAVAAVPVVMFTSSSHSVDINTAYLYGVNSYLVKPETTAQLESMLNLLKSYWFMVNRQPDSGRTPVIAQ
ncbi:MAG: response regulator [Acidobacteriaceae bacterium]